MSILHPVFAMVVLVAGFGIWTFRVRKAAVVSGQVPMAYFATFSEGQPTEDVLKTQRYWANLFEVPVLFYAVVAIILSLGLDDAVYAWAGWGFVAARVVQGWIHVTHNTIMHRFYAYVAGNVLLLAIWGRLAWQNLG